MSCAPPACGRGDLRIGPSRLREGLGVGVGLPGTHKQKGGPSEPPLRAIYLMPAAYCAKASFTSPEAGTCAAPLGAKRPLTAAPCSMVRVS